MYVQYKLLIELIKSNKYMLFAPFNEDYLDKETDEWLPIELSALSSVSMNRKKQTLYYSY